MLCLFLLTGSEAQHAPDPQICDERLGCPVEVGQGSPVQGTVSDETFLAIPDASRANQQYCESADRAANQQPLTIRGSARQRQRRHRHIRIGEFGDIRRLITNGLAVVILDLLDAHCWRAHIGRNSHGYLVFRLGIVQAGNGVGRLGFLHRVGVGAGGLVYDFAKARLVICGIRADRDGS